MQKGAWSDANRQASVNQFYEATALSPVPALQTIGRQGLRKRGFAINPPSNDNGSLHCFIIQGAARKGVAGLVPAGMEAWLQGFRTWSVAVRRHRRRRSMILSMNPLTSRIGLKRWSILNKCSIVTGAS